MILFHQSRIGYTLFLSAITKSNSFAISPRYLAPVQFANSLAMTTSASTSANPSLDPHKFLENVLGPESLEWVESQNSACLSKFGEPTQTEDYKRLLAIMDSKDKIPSVAQIGSPSDGYYYNFWQDDKHVQGIWRKTTLESYRTNSPEWQTVLDLDALEAPTTDTASTWVWHGSTLLEEGPGESKWDRALIALSPGGSDADTTREFDLVKEKFIDEEDGGFAMPTAAKTSIAYRSREEVLVGTDFEGDGSSMTDSGYPRVIKSWKRGTPIEDAKIIFEGEKSDVSVGQYSYFDRDGMCHEFQYRSLTFYTTKYWYRTLSSEQIVTSPSDEEATPFIPIPIPEDAEISTFGSDAMITLRSDWTPPGSDTLYQAGALISAPMNDVMNDQWTSVTCLFQPTPTKSLQSTTTTKDYVILSVLEDVRTALEVWKCGETTGNWKLMPAEENAVTVGESLRFGNVNRDSAVDNRVFLWRDGYLIPDTLELCDAGSLAVTEPLKAKPAMFAAEDLCVDQHFCNSKDGTKIPYFVMRKKDIVLDGTNPTLLDAYGGFEISMLPGYAAGVGAAWLEKGGVKVIANIRGGGEYGPAWHQAALKSKRNKCFEDMEAVAQDLIDRKITSSEKLACIGGSNGGLMVGNLITRPIASKLFGAAVCQVPLLDMKEYSHLLAGASWMAEYGNPDIPEEWAFLRHFSPYHMLRHDNLGLAEEGVESTVKNPDWVCPKVLFTTSTRDDRVHPGHARKMVRSLLEEAQPLGKAPEVHYWENVEGGHGGAADNKQRAHMWALTYSMLKQTLGLKE
mmetsp:Transcript_13161/g.15472  ORF Transcript_13161/g.15472 Transcript_13161/m.15472 type:complete len:794 (-) Transcript_13161:66-2447(-)